MPSQRANLESSFELCASVFILMVCTITRVRLMLSLFSHHNEKYHKYAQFISSYWFLLPESVALYVTLFDTRPDQTYIPRSFILAVLMASLAQLLLSALSAKLLHGFYLLSPARGDLLLQSGGAESWKSSTGKVLVTAQLVCSFVGEAVWAIEMLQEIPGNKLDSQNQSKLGYRQL